MPLTPCYSSTETAQTTTLGVIKVDGGYLFTEEALRDTVAGWTSDRVNVVILQRGMDELHKEIEAQAASTKQLIDELKQDLADERKRYKKQIRKGRFGGFIIGAAIGAAVVALSD